MNASVLWCSCVVSLCVCCWRGCLALSLQPWPVTRSCCCRNWRHLRPQTEHCGSSSESSMNPRYCAGHCLHLHHQAVNQRGVLQRWLHHHDNMSNLLWRCLCSECSFERNCITFSLSLLSYLQNIILEKCEVHCASSVSINGYKTVWLHKHWPMSEV